MIKTHGPSQWRIFKEENYMLHLHFRKINHYLGWRRKVLVVRRPIIGGVQAGDNEDLDNEKRRESLRDRRKNL